MITAFPPNILLCIDKKYKEPKAFIQEDAMQLMVDHLAQEDPHAGWENHDISQDETVRARRIDSGEGGGEYAHYKGSSFDGKTYIFVVEQFDRNGSAKIKEMYEEK